MTDFDRYMNKVVKPLEFLPIKSNQAQRLIALAWGLFILPASIMLLPLWILYEVIK